MVVTAAPGATSDTPHSAMLVASDKETRVETPLAMDIERHTLTVRTPGITDPTARWITTITDLDRETATAFAHTFAFRLGWLG